MTSKSPICSPHLSSELPGLKLQIPSNHFYLQVLLLLLLLSRFSHVRLCTTPETAAHQGPCPWVSPGKNLGVGCHFLLQCMKGKVKVKSLSRVRLVATPWTTAYQAPPSVGFSRREYWSGLPLPSPYGSCKQLKTKTRL